MENNSKDTSKRVRSQHRCASVAEELAIGEKTAPQPNASKEKLKVKYNLDLCYDNVFELENDTQSWGINVKGNLKNNLSYWESIGANETVKSIIKEGYKIPFITTPEKAIFKNNFVCTK